MAKKFWVITMTTRKFEFIAAGITEDEAMAAMKRRYDKHINSIPMSNRGDALTWDQFIEKEGTNPVDFFDTTTKLVACGRAYLDDETEEKP